MAKPLDDASLAVTVRTELSRLFSHVGKRPAKLVIGLSGGVDSTVLLNVIAAETTMPVHALHIHHGLSANADGWERHCQQVCLALGIHFVARRVTVEQGPRKSLEASARDARYSALLEYCKAQNAALLLGQHQDDQLETFLLQLNRGAGPRGLSCMPASTYRDSVLVLRPMLCVPRERIVKYAREHHLTWIEDESNTDTRFDRNFLRQDVIPVLTQRWPQLPQTAARSSQLIAEQTAMLEEVVSEKLRACKAIPDNENLNVTALKALSPSWRRAVLRGWLAESLATLPTQAQMQEIEKIIVAKPDSQPLCQLGAFLLRRYSGRLMLTTTLSEPVAQPLVSRQLVQLAWWPVPFRVESKGEVWVKPAWEEKQLRLAANPLAKTPKAWFKEWKIPPWERKQIPLILIDGVPVAVVLKNTVVYLAGAGDCKVTLAKHDQI